MKKMILTILIFIVLSVAGLIFAKTKYISQEALSSSENFLNLLLAEKFEDAYLLTNKSSDIGKTFEDFKARAQKQMPIKKSEVSDLIVLVQFVFPPQTYGNRVRRFLTGEKVEQDKISIGFELTGTNTILLFEVRLRQNEEGDWRVVYFQSHAG